MILLGSTGLHFLDSGLHLKATGLDSPFVAGFNLGFRKYKFTLMSWNRVTQRKIPSRIHQLDSFLPEFKFLCGLLQHVSAKQPERAQSVLEFHRCFHFQLMSGTLSQTGAADPEFTLLPGQSVSSHFKQMVLPPGNLTVSCLLHASTGQLAESDTSLSQQVSLSKCEA
jgi:hypothetical protein